MIDLVISPHLDDAILSIGGTLAAQEPWNRVVTIASVCARIPPWWYWPSPFDSASGFTSSDLAVITRRTEDREACRRIGVRACHLDYYDGQYGFARDDECIAGDLRWLFANSERVAVPLGLAHPDHRLVARVCRYVMREFPAVEWFVYAELPAASLWRGHVRGARRGWERAGWRLDPVRSQPNLVAKQVARRAYASQLRFPELAFENLTKERLWTARYEG